MPAGLDNSGFPQLTLGTQKRNAPQSTKTHSFLYKPQLRFPYLPRWNTKLQSDLKMIIFDIILPNMNPDYYSDIKLAERFIFESSIYLLNIFQKKIDSFINNKTKQSRAREMNELCHPQHIIDPDSKNEDPIKALSKDLTKPVWNCITKTDVVAVCIKNGNIDQDHERVRAMNEVMLRFLERFKHEHEDESNLRINLEVVEKGRMIEELKQQIHSRRLDKSWYLLQELIALMLKVIRKYENVIKQLQQRNQNDQPFEVYVRACRQMFEQFLMYDEEKKQFIDIDVQLPAELYCFADLVYEQIKAVIESIQGPTCINFWPNLIFLPELIHPLFLGIYITIKDQLTSDRNLEKDQKQRAPTPNPNTMTFSTNQSIEEQTDCVFGQLPQRNCSKITFLNLDGYDSPFNLLLSKYLSKYVQYITFPLEEGDRLKKQGYFHYFQYYLQFLVKNYVLGELTSQQRQLQYKLFKTKQRSQKQLMDYYRRLFVFPINSIYLTQKYGFENIEFYQSKFIKFVMKELIYIQVKEFNPSIIILSHSNQLFLDAQFFEELVKELTIISNMKIIFYNNLTKNYIYQTKLPPNMRESQEFYAAHQLYNRKYSQRISMFNHNDINYSLFDKTSIFLKIASGTYTLDRTLEQDNATEKYDIFKIQKYGGNLIKLLGKSHPVLQRYRNRCNQYLRLERMLSSIYQSQRANEDNFHRNLSLYKQELLRLTEELLISLVNKQSSSPEPSFARYVSIEDFESQWRDFVLRYQLGIQRERQEEDYKYFTRLKKSQQTQDDKVDQFIAIQFQIQQKGLAYLVNISKNSQICMKMKQEGIPTLVYLFNHLVDHRDGVLRSFCGEVGEKVEKSYEGKVKLREIELTHSELKTPFQHFTKFNYFQTSTHVILFWPTLYDEAEDLISQFLHTSYIPKITNLIFLAQKTAPHRFIPITPANDDYQRILPRCGCTCYQVPSTDIIYIFGGFYTDRQNYLSFQVDITMMLLTPHQMQVSNVPKRFHFDYQQTNPNYTDLPYRITKLSEDFVRPRIQYEVYEVDKNEDLQTIEIFLMGGVGQKFMRPYSMIGYMAHQIVFRRQDGELLQIRRIKLNNLVPINLRQPVKTRSHTQLLAICGAQNRQIYTKKMTLPANTPTYCWFNNKYIKQDQKMTYKKSIELAVITESRQDKIQNTIITKQNNSNITAKVVLRHYSSLKQIDNKLALIYQYSNPPVEQSSSIIYSVELELSDEVYMRFVNLPSKRIPLIGSNIISIDIYGLQIYAILRHEDYTNNKYVLVHCDVTNTVQSLIDEKQRKIMLREIYRFDDNIQHFTLKALPQKKIAVIHSFPLHQNIHYEQFLLRKSAKGPYIREKIYNDYQSYSLNTFLNVPVYHSHPISFYLTSKNTVVSWTFLTNSRTLGEQEYFFLIEQLNCKEEFKRWKLKTLKMIRFQKMFISNKEAPNFITTILDIKVTGEKKYEIFVQQSDKIYVGNFDIHLSQTYNVTLRQHDKPIQEYYIEKFRHKFNVEYLQKLTKYPSRYVDNLEEMEVENTQ